MRAVDFVIAVDFGGTKVAVAERIAVGGGLMARADRVLGALARRLRAALPFGPELVSARFVHDGALRGAVALALDLAGSPARPSPLSAAASGDRS